MSVNKAVIFTAIVALGVIGTIMLTNTPKAQPTSEVQIRRDMFEQWKLLHGKSYEIAEENEKRFKIWSENYDFVQEHNKLPENTYTVGMNVFADISNSEWKSLLAKCITTNATNTTASTTVAEEVAISANLPTSVDWRTKNAVTPIKNQQQCGSCWAFSTTGSLEGLNAISSGTLESFSEQQLVDCSSSYGNQGCNGGLMDNAFKYVASQGIELASSYPYTAQTGTCKYSSSKTVFKNTAYTDVATNSQNSLAAAVAQQPVSIAIEADTSAFQLYTSGVFNNKGCGTSLDHGVLVVGYNTESTNNTTPYWIVKNSWGESWGDAGYILIAKTTASGPGICGLAMDPSYPTLSSAKAPKTSSPHSSSNQESIVPEFEEEGSMESSEMSF